jgi:uncharacterized protein
VVAVHCTDYRDGRAETHRRTALAAHLSYVESILDEIAVAGPLRDEAGSIIGSLLIFRTESLAQAKALLERDPYFNAQIWEHVSFHHFGGSAGAWVGGKTW